MLSFVSNGMIQWSVPAVSEDGARSGTWNKTRSGIRACADSPFGSFLRATDLASAGKMETTNKTYLQHPQLTAVEVPVRAARTGSNGVGAAQNFPRRISVRRAIIIGELRRRPPSIPRPLPAANNPPPRPCRSPRALQLR